MFQPNKTLGGILLIISIMITVNIFTLSIASVNVGFIVVAFLLVVMWALTTTTGLLVLEVALNFKEYANGFSSMAEKTLGKTGKVIVAACFLLLFYAIIASYLSSVISLPGVKIYSLQLPCSFNAIFLVLIVGGIIFYGTRAVDLCNRGLITIKGLCLLTMFAFLLPKTNVDIMPQIRSPNFSWVWYLSMTVALLLGTFKFHIYIPRLCNYLDAKASELKHCIIVGSVVSLIIGLLLLLVGKPYFTRAISSKWFFWSINGFYNIALSTSFFLISLGLFDFVADSFKRENSKIGKLQTILLTFVPPFILSLFYPQGFLWVLKYAAFFTAILMVILPALMAYRMRAISTTPPPYQVFGGKLLLIIIMVAGVFLAAIPFI